MKWSKLEQRVIRKCQQDIETHVPCIGIDDKQHVCEPDRDICKCGIKVKRKKLLKDDYLKISCYECTY